MKAKLHAQMAGQVASIQHYFVMGAYIVMMLVMKIHVVGILHQCRGFQSVKVNAESNRRLIQFTLLS